MTGSLRGHDKRFILRVDEKRSAIYLSISTAGLEESTEQKIARWKEELRQLDAQVTGIHMAETGMPIPPGLDRFWAGRRAEIVRKIGELTASPSQSSPPPPAAGLEEIGIKSSQEVFGRSDSSEEMLANPDRPEWGEIRPISLEVLNQALQHLPASFVKGLLQASPPGLVYQRAKLPFWEMGKALRFPVAIGFNVWEIGRQEAQHSFAVGIITLFDFPDKLYGDGNRLKRAVFLPSLNYRVLQGVLSEKLRQEIQRFQREKEGVIEPKLGSLPMELFFQYMILHEVGGILWTGGYLPNSFKKRWETIYPHSNNPEMGPIYLRNQIRSMTQQVLGKKGGEETFWEESFSDKFALFFLNGGEAALFAELGWVLRPEERRFFEGLMDYFQKKMDRGLKVHELIPAAGLEEETVFSAQGLAIDQLASELDKYLPWGFDYYDGSRVREKYLGGSSALFPAKPWEGFSDLHSFIQKTERTRFDVIILHKEPDVPSGRTYAIIIGHSAGLEEKIEDLVVGWIELYEASYEGHLGLSRQEALARLETVLSARREEALDLLNRWVQTPGEVVNHLWNYPHGDFAVTDLVRMLVLRPENVHHVPTLEKAVEVLGNYHPDGERVQRHNQDMQESVAGTLGRARLEAEWRRRQRGSNSGSAVGLEESGITRRQFLGSTAAAIFGTRLLASHSLPEKPVPPAVDPKKWRLVGEEDIAVDPATPLTQKVEIAAQGELANPLRNNFQGIRVQEVSTDPDKAKGDLQNFTSSDQIQRMVVLDRGLFTNKQEAAQIMPSQHAPVLMIYRSDAQLFTPAVVAVILKKYDLTASGIFLLNVHWDDEHQQIHLNLYA